MTRPPLPARLGPILRRSFHELDEEALGRLVGLSEAPDLDFKREPIKSQPLAVLVAAMANSGGGLVVIGISDDGQGAAAELCPIETGHIDEVLRMQQAVAELVAPHPQLRIRPVPSTTEPGRTFYVLAVPRSTNAPHAVRINKNLRYVVRDGPSNRPLTETEVADRYRSRFATARAQVSELEQLVVDAEELARHSFQHRDVGLLVSLAPTPSSGLRLHHQLAGEYQTWLREFDQSEALPALSAPSQLHASVDFRVLRLRDDAAHKDDRRPERVGALHLDGRGYLAFKHPRTNRRTDLAGKARRVYAEALVTDLVNALAILARHAVRAGAYGDAAVAAALKADLTLGDSLPPVLLSINRSGQISTVPGTREMHSLSSRVRTYDPRDMHSDTGVSRHSVDLDDIASGGAGLLVAARGLASDLFSAFGEPGPDHIEPDGTLNLEAFDPGLNTALTSWLGSRLASTE